MGLCVWLVWPEATEYDCKHLHTHGIRWTMISIQVQLIFLVCVCVLDGEEDEEEGERGGYEVLGLNFPLINRPTGLSEPRQPATELIFPRGGLHG